MDRDPLNLPQSASHLWGAASRYCHSIERAPIFGIGFQRKVDRLMWGLSSLRVGETSKAEALARVPGLRELHDEDGKKSCSADECLGPDTTELGLEPADLVFPQGLPRHLRSIALLGNTLLGTRSARRCDLRLGRGFRLSHHPVDANTA